VAGGLLVGVASVFTLVTGHEKVAAIADRMLTAAQANGQTLPILIYKFISD